MYGGHLGFWRGDLLFNMMYYYTSRVTHEPHLNLLCCIFFELSCMQRFEKMFDMVTYFSICIFCVLFRTYYVVT
jgi:hypothetical protein